MKGEVIRRSYKRRLSRYCSAGAKPTGPTMRDQCLKHAQPHKNASIISSSDCGVYVLYFRL
jgi:hypothetical protein